MMGPKRKKNESREPTKRRVQQNKGGKDLTKVKTMITLKVSFVSVKANRGELR